MAYKCEVIEYSPKADTLAARVEEKANEMLKDGYELVTFSVTNSAKAVLVFKKSFLLIFILVQIIFLNAHLKTDNQLIRRKTLCLPFLYLTL